jgi:hypothetical protein
MTHIDYREVAEGLQYQGEGEIFAYIVTTTATVSSPTSPSVDVFADTDDYTASVKSTVMPSGSPTVAGDAITLPELQSLTAGVKYKVEVTFSAGGNTFVHYFYVMGER